MKTQTYSRQAAEALAPLLDSILREIEDRSKELFSLERRHRRIDPTSADAETVASGLVADIAVQKRELRYARQELAELGCTLEDAGTLAVRIPGADEEDFLWQPGVGLQSEVPTAA